MDNQKVKILRLTVATQNLLAFMFIIGNNVNIIKYILKQKQILWNLLASFWITQVVLVLKCSYTRKTKIGKTIVV